VTIADDNYPLALKQIYDPPPLLFARGKLPAPDDVAVAIVGSRSCTRYGLQVAEKIADDLAAAGLIVVSGLARGIDSAAHRGALRAAGRTIGVLGCGLDVVYPPENGGLYEKVAGSGALITEFLFGAKPDKHNFPSRNRIISGLCQGVLLVEAGRSSGALLTAKHALDQNRDVLAVPGNINSAPSYGTNELIKQGAIPVTSTADVLLALGLDPRTRSPRSPARQVEVPERERKVLGLLSDQPQQADRLSESLRQPIAEVLTLLLNLEMAGLVRQLPGKLFVKES
jgi:DNA processing protein